MKNIELKKIRAKKAAMKEQYLKKREMQESSQLFSEAFKKMKVQMRDDSLFQSVEENYEDEEMNMPNVLRTFTKRPPKKLKAEEFPFDKKVGQSDFCKHFELDVDLLKKHLVKLDEDELELESGTIKEEANIDKNMLNYYLAGGGGTQSDSDELGEDKELVRTLNNDVKFDSWKYRTPVHHKKIFKISDQGILEYN